MEFMQNIKKAVDVQTVVLPMLNVQELLELDVKDLQMNEENARAIKVDFEAGEAAEQERIIRLLKDSGRCALDKGHDTKGYCFCEAVELIKGEFNE